MKKHLRCVVCAAVATLLIIFGIHYAFNVGKEQKRNDTPVQQAAQSDVVVEDFIHDNYVIREKNPWTDYSMHPVYYTEAQGKTFQQKIDAKAAILIDPDTKTILYAKNPNQKMYPASTTKLMTALTVLQIMSANDVITVGNEVSMIASDSSKAGFAKGQVVTVEELLKGLLVSSGNDAAYILAKAGGQAIFDDNIAYEGKKFSDIQCIQRFVLEMNKNVRDMELTGTNFTTPDGYDDRNQFTTASDLSKIAIEAYNNELIAEICKQGSVKSESLDKTWISTNELLNKSSSYYYKYCMGLKTGSTDLAGKCLVSVGKKGDKECISVVLHDRTDEQRFHDSKKLLSFGLDR